MVDNKKYRKREDFTDGIPLFVSSGNAIIGFYVKMNIISLRLASRLYELLTSIFFYYKEQICTQLTPILERILKFHSSALI